METKTELSKYIKLSCSLPSSAPSKKNLLIQVLISGELYKTMPINENIYTTPPQEHIEDVKVC